MPANSRGMMLWATMQRARQLNGPLAMCSIPTEQEARTKSTGVTDINEARKWLKMNGHIDNISDTIELGTLKNVLLQLARHADMTMEIRDGLRAVAYGLDANSADAMQKTVAKVMEKAMENCKEIIGELMEKMVKSIESIVNQVRETVGRVEERREEEKAEQASKMKRGGSTNWIGRTYAEVTQRVEQEDIDHRNRSRSCQMIIDNAQGGGDGGD